MTTFLIIAGTMIIVYAMLYLMAPIKYEIFRSVIIEKPLPEVFSFISLIKNQDIWSPWGRNVSEDEKTFTGTDGEVGFISAWEGSKEIGKGEQEIMNIVPNRTIETQLRFIKPFKVTSDSYIKVYEAGEHTEVLWGFKGVYKRPLNVVVFFMGIDKKLGRDFEVGLSKLKHYIEA
ncbi:MAG: SRPBCC family protein [Flavobacteriaceae bacterium]|nr:SRPBCC family protein [Flavobacteriaceae bacterium]